MITTLIITWQNDGMLLTTFPFVKCCSDTCLISRFLVVHSLLTTSALTYKWKFGGVHFSFHPFDFDLTRFIFIYTVYRWRSVHASNWSFRAVAPIITLCSVWFVRFCRAFTLFLREPCGKSQPHVRTWKKLHHWHPLLSGTEIEAACTVSLIQFFLKGSLLSSWLMMAGK